MAGAPPPYPPPYSSQPDWKYQRRAAREQAKAQRDLARVQWKMYRDQRRMQVRGARGGSLLGPLLVISIGVVFLLLRIGRLQYASVGIWYERWWPLLLLGGGVVLLAEWAFDRSHAADHPYPYRSRLGGGVVTMLLLVCIPGILLTASHGDINMFTHGPWMNGDNLEEFLGDRHESDQQLDQAFAPGTRLTIDNPHGDVTVTGSSVDGQIHVAVHKQVFARSDSEAGKKAADLSPGFTSSGEGMMLIVPSVDGARADLTVTLPAQSATTITANHGNIHVSALKAALTLNANHGDVDLEAIGGTVTAHINNRGSSFNAHNVNGSLSIEGNGRDVDIADVTGAVSLGGDFFGTTHLEHVGGPVRFHTSRTDFQVVRLDGEVDIKHGELSGDQIVGPVSLSARSYNVTLDKVAGDVSVTTSDGSVDLTSAPPLGNVTIQNRNGSVNVTVPEHAAFTVQAETRDGDVDTDFPVTKTDENSTSRMSGTVGTGGPLIRINTTQNDISLKKGVIAPLAPAAASPALPNPAPLPQHAPGRRPKAPPAPVGPATDF